VAAYTNVDLPPNDAERFEALYREHYAAIVRFARRRIDPSSAEEVVADTFATAWRRIDVVPIDAPLPWLYEVAGRILQSHRRADASSRDKAANAARVSPAEYGRDPAEAFAERERVLRAFTTLSAADREALRLVAWEGLDHADAARVAGTSRSAFTMRVARARRRLAKALSELEDRATEFSAAPAAQIHECQT
jgi:RNA polymerase sigma-70 factor, ECF subfamily